MNNFLGVWPTKAFMSEAIVDVEDKELTVMNDAHGSFPLEFVSNRIQV